PPRACGYEDKPAVMALLHQTWGVDALSAEQLREIKAVYHAQVKLVDAMAGRTLALLEARGLRGDTLVVFTSDHGDFAGEYGLVEKWDTLFHEEIMRVPLIIAGPGIRNPGRGSQAMVENLDILPSLLDLLDIAPAPCVQHALSFAPLLRGETDQHRASVYAEGGVELEGLHRTAPLQNSEAYSGKHRALALDPLTLASARMLRTPTHKLVFRREGVNELYDLNSPDGESVNGYADPANAPLLAELLPQLLARQIAAAPRSPALPETGVMA
ncbi:MAG: sulfatase-like hydrolase/transferase, partial [Opitutales bacterium]